MTTAPLEAWRTSPEERGFTLLELGIVIAVLAIVSSFFVPDFMEAARTTMAAKAADEVVQIQDAARWYFSETVRYTGVGAPQDPRTARWPGQAVAGTCVAVNAIGDMTAQGFLKLDPASINPAGQPINAWGNPYLVDVLPGPTGPADPHCHFRVRTQLPQPLAQAYTGMVPGASCVVVGGGLVECTSVIPKPGAEASVAWKYFK
jgi:prepilin-type N-terminal cleavage/methylation domain-containing protein